MLNTFELPHAPAELAQTHPIDLLPYNIALGYFASNPRRLGPHIALAANPDRPRSPLSIAKELAAAATPQVAVDEEYIADRLTKIFAIDAVDETGQRAVTRVSPSREGTKLTHSETGQKVLPLVALLAGRWLVKHRATEWVLPPLVKRAPLLRHGTRLAGMQYCIAGEANTRTIAHDLKLDRLRVGIRTMFGQLEEDGLVVHGKDPEQPVYAVTTKAKPAVRAVLTELHSLADPSYAKKLRAGIRQITGDPVLYGRLAHAALVDLAATQRNHAAEGR